MTIGIRPEPQAPPHKVVFLTTGLATGGAETMLLKLCTRFDRRRVNPVVVSLSDKGTIGPRIEALGVPVHALRIVQGRFSLAGGFRLRRLISDLRPALIQGWMYHGNLAAAVVAGDCPLMWGIRQSLYGLAQERRLTRWVIRANALLSKRPSAIVYNSRTSARQHHEFGFEAATACMIPNGFDTDLFRADPAARSRVRHEIGIDDQTVLIGLIGRYHPMKDHGVFLTAAASLLKIAPQARFLLAGTGINVANSALSAMIAERHLGNRVLLLGERADMPEVIAALDIATSTSSWGEGFSNAIGEAMSCGVPCVVTDVGDSAAIVENGKVAPSRDATALTAALSELIALGREGRGLLGMQARERIVTSYSLGAVVEQYENLYERVIARARP